MLNTLVKISFIIAALALPFVVMTHLHAQEETAAETTFDDDQKAAMKELFREFLMENPEVIMESVEQYQINQTQAAEQAFEDNLAEVTPALTAADAPDVGNSEGDVTIIEFFDYNCGYCHRAFDDIAKLVEADDKVRVVFREYPILSPASEVAARWALAAQKQDKYFEFHKAVMEFEGPKTEETLGEIAGELGLDLDKLKQDAEAEDIKQAIADNRKYAEQLGVQGTPAFIIGKQIVRGYVGYDGLKALVEDQRSKEGA